MNKERLKNISTYNGDNTSNVDSNDSKVSPYNKYIFEHSFVDFDEQKNAKK